MKKFLLLCMSCFVLFTFEACGNAADTNADTAEAGEASEKLAKKDDAAVKGVQELSKDPEANGGESKDVLASDTQGDSLDAMDSAGSDRQDDNAGAAEPAGSSVPEAPADNGGDAGAATEPAVVPDNTAGAGNDQSADGYREIYKSKIEGAAEDTAVYSLIYLDGDDVPELAVYDAGYEAYSIYTVKNGELFCIVDSMRTTEMTYYERSGIIALFTSWNGGGDEGGYGKSYYQASTDKTLTNDDQPVLNFAYNASYDEEGAYTGEGVTDYYDMGKEIDEAAFQQKLEGLGVAGDGKAVCAGDVLTKAEAIEALSQ